MKKKLLVAVVFFVLALILGAFTVFAGTSFDSASVMKENTNYNCNISNQGTYQYYKFVPECTGVYVFYTDGSYDTRGYLYNSSRNQIASDDDSGYEDNFNITYTLSKGETYYLSAGMYDSDDTGSFTVSVYLDYEIRSISSASIKLSKTSYSYNGQERKPKITVTDNGRTLEEYNDYYISFSSNKNVGTGYVTITGTGDYTGTVKKSFKINPRKVKGVSFNNQHYDGKVKTPAVYINETMYNEEYDYTYKDRVKVPKSQYTIKISGKHKNVGQYTATIKFKGNYRGTVKKKFYIRPQRPQSIRAKALDTKRVKIYWKKAKQADGYEIYRYNPKKGKYTLYKRIKGTSITLSPLKGDHNVSVDIRSYKNYKGKRIVSDFKYKSARPKLTKPKIKSVNWVSGSTYDINMSEYDSYEIEVSKNSYFSGASTYKGYFQTSRWRLCPQCSVHYVRVRRYVYNNGTYKYGPWSDVRKIYL